MLQKGAKGQELVDKVCEHINLLEKDYFSCSFRDNANIKVVSSVFNKSFSHLTERFIIHQLFIHFAGCLSSITYLVTWLAISSYLSHLAGRFTSHKSFSHLAGHFVSHIVILVVILSPGNAINSWSSLLNNIKLVSDVMKR